MRKNLLFCTCFLLLYNIINAQQREIAFSSSVSDNWYNEAVSKLLKLEHDFYASERINTFRTVNTEDKTIFEITPSHYAIPLNKSPEWQTSIDGVISGLLSDAQMKAGLYGFAVSSLGDVNGDDFDDVAITAPGLADIFSGSGTANETGAVFVYYGSASGLPTTPSKKLQPSSAAPGALFGYSVTGGDVTGDEINDIIIGAPLDRYPVTVPDLFGSSNVTVAAGRVFIYEGGNSLAVNPAPTTEVKLGNSFFSKGFAGLTSNTTINALFGFSLAATSDLNGDGKQDLLIGAPSYRGTAIASIQNGSAFIYYSGNLTSALPAQFQLPSPATLGLVQFPGISSSALLFGYSVDGTGDYNGDGHADIIIGAPGGADLSSLGGLMAGKVLSGSAYVYYGNGAGINTTIGAVLQGSSGGMAGNAADLFGYKVKGVMNVDGLRNGNILVGAPEGGLLSNALSLTIKTGNIQLFKKQPSSPSGIIVADQVLESPKSTSLLQTLNVLQLNVLFGTSLDNAYDINCDGFPDIVVGEPLSSGTNISQLQASAAGGAAYVFYGVSDGSYNPIPVYEVAASYGNDIASINATAIFGFSVAGIRNLSGPPTIPRILVGSPSGALDFDNSALNLGSTLGVLFDFAAGDNGLGKAYTFLTPLCVIFQPLPVKLVNLTGRENDKKVILDWKTFHEKDILEYAVEKSKDGKNFSTMAYIRAKGSRATNSYELTDYQPAAGLNYYRLRIIDNDKAYSYSGVIKIRLSEKENIQITVSPNPVINQYSIKLSGLQNGSYKIEMKNNQGQSFSRKDIIVTRNEYTGDMNRQNSMAPGVYSIHVFDTNSRLVKSYRFVVR